MLLYAGIDEAGYGPMLGPLCVGMSIFLVERHEEGSPPPNLWETLEDGVCSSPRDKQRRIAVADSKRLKGSSQAKSHPLRHLERGVLAFLAAINQENDLADLDDESLFGQLGAELPSTVATPWYKSTTALPVAHETSAIAIAANRLRTTLDRAGVRPLAIGCKSVDAGDLNARMAAGANKAAVNQDAALGQLATIRRIAAEVGENAVPRIVIDRQGGRTRYREWLGTCLDNARIRVLGETERISRYEVNDDQGSFVVSFEAESEARHLPVALASMVAKYIRELAMLRMNRFFNERIPDLRPTAGYVQDGRRFLDEVRPVIETEQLDAAVLVRRA